MNISSHLVKRSSYIRKKNNNNTEVYVWNRSGRQLQKREEQSKDQTLNGNILFDTYSCIVSK